MAEFQFYFFAFLTVVAAAGVVVNRNAVNAALCLLLSFAGMAALFVLLEAYFLAALQSVDKSLEEAARVDGASSTSALYPSSAAWKIDVRCPVSDMLAFYQTRAISSPRRLPPPR